MFVRLGRLFFKSGKFSISAVVQADNEPWGADQPLPAPYSLLQSQELLKVWGFVLVIRLKDFAGWYFKVCN